MTQVVPGLAVTPQEDHLSVDEGSVDNPLEVVANDSILPTNNYVSTPKLLSVSLAYHGHASLDTANNRVTYTPAAHYFGLDCFNYTVGEESNNRPSP